MKGFFRTKGSSMEFISFATVNSLYMFDNKKYFFVFSKTSYKIGEQDYWADIDGTGKKQHIQPVLTSQSMKYDFPDLISFVISQIMTNMVPKYFDPSKSTYTINRSYSGISLYAEVITQNGVIAMLTAKGNCFGEDWEFSLVPSKEEVNFSLPEKMYTRQVKKIRNSSTLDKLVNSTPGYLSLDEIIRRHPEKEYSWLLNRDYVIVNKDNLPSILEEIHKAIDNNQLMSMDTETTGLNIHMSTADGESDQLVGVIISVREGQGWFFPVQMKYIPSFWGGDNSEHKEMVVKYLKDILEQGKFIGHNSSFDWKVMWLYHINTNFVEDTQTFALMGWCNDHYGQSVGLKELTQFFLHRDPLELDDISATGKWDDSKKFSDLPYEIVRLYGCADGDDTLSLFNEFIRTGQREMYGLDKPAYRIEVQFQKVAGYQEFYGHHIDVDRLPELVNKIEEEVNAAQEEIVKMGGAGVNLNSPKQMKHWLVDERHWKIKWYTPTGNPSFKKADLAKYAEMKDKNGNLLYPEAAAIQRQKVAMYAKSNFVDKYDALGTSDGFLFSHVGFPEATGRVQINTPNYQSYSDDMRAYIVPRKNCYMIDMDYSSVEYRILATLSRQQSLIDFFHNPDADYHTYQAARMFNIPYGKVSKELRHQAKHINFGLPYGMGPRKLGFNIFGEENDVNTAKARKLVDLYFQGQEKVQKFFVDKRALTITNRYAETRFGRRRYFPVNARQDVMERQGGNMPIQGTAADIYKIGVVRLFNQIANEGYLGKFLLPAFMHDEILCEIDNSIKPSKALKMILDNMQVKRYGIDVNNIDNEAPLVMGGGFGTNWKNAKSTEIPVALQPSIESDNMEWWHGDCKELYDWETYKIAEYGASRVRGYLENRLDSKAVDVIISDYAKSLLQWLSGIDKFTVAPDIKEYGDWSVSGSPDWVNTQAYNDWVRNDWKSLPAKPIDLLNTAYYILTGKKDICQSLGIFDPNDEDSSNQEESVNDESDSNIEKTDSSDIVDVFSDANHKQSSVSNEDMLNTLGYCIVNGILIVKTPYEKFTVDDLTPILNELSKNIGKDTNVIASDVMLSTKDMSNAVSTKMTVGSSELPWIKDYAKQLVVED